MKQTKIEWVKNRDGSQGDTWNMMVGCRKVSPGCTNCYAERLVNGRLQGDFKQIVLKPERLKEPLHVRKPTTYFVNSLSDLWLAPYSFLDQVLAVMLLTPRHTYIVATKRPQVALDYLAADPDLRARVAIEMTALLCQGQRPDGVPELLRPQLPVPNLWHLVSCEDQTWYDRRVPILMRIPAARRGVSLEPLLGPIQLAHGGLDWVIVGGESGPNARPMNQAWVRSLRHQCQLAGVPFLFKQWGEWLPADQGTGWHGTTAILNQIDGVDYFRVGKKAAGRLLDGETWDGMPAFSERPAER